MKEMDAIIGEPPKRVKPGLVKLDPNFTYKKHACSHVTTFHPIYHPSQMKLTFNAPPGMATSVHPLPDNQDISTRVPLIAETSLESLPLKPAQVI